MAGAPLYVSRQQFGALFATPNLPTGEDVYRAGVSGARENYAAGLEGIRNLGSATRATGEITAKFAQVIAADGTTLGDAIIKAHEKTQLAEAKTAFFEQAEAARKTALDDPDYANSPKTFGQSMRQVEANTIGKLSPTQQAEARLDTVRYRLSLQRDIDSDSLTKTADADTASWNKDQTVLMDRAARAQSDIERQAVYSDADKRLEESVSNGLITRAEGVRRRQVLQKNVDNADVARGNVNDPVNTLAALDDPNRFTTLTPSEREAWKAQSRGVIDEQDKLRRDELTRRDPALAAGLSARLTDRGQGDAVFERFVVPQESAGDPNAVSKAGAIGLSQLMPDTARKQLRKANLKEIADLPDAVLVDQLKDPALNLQLGKAEWSDLLTRFRGNVWAAAAGYNAGTGTKDKPRADAWHAEAVEKFGDHYTAAQLASLIPIAETRDYVLKLGRAMGDNPALSFKGTYASAEAYDSQIKTQQAAELKNLKTLVSLTNDERDTLTTSFKSDYLVNPERIAAAKAPLIAAASAGDADAAVKLRQFETLERLAPIVHDAYRAKPEELVAAISALEAKATAGGASSGDLKRLEVLRAVNDEVTSARKSNPVALAERREGQVVVLPPIKDPGFTDAMVARAAQAERANATYGGALKVFKPEEVATFKAQLGEATPREELAAIAAVTRGLSSRSADAAVEQLTDNSPLKRFAAGLFARDTELAQSLVEGARATSANENYAPHKGAQKTTYYAQLDRYLPVEAFNPAARMDPHGPYAAMVEAAQARYAYLSAAAKDVSGNLDTSRLKRAVEDVTGGILAHNGGSVIAPERGMSQRDFDMVMWGVKDDDLKGVATRNGTAISADYLRGSAKLQAFGDGTYFVQVNRDDAAPQYAMKHGTPFLIDLRNRPKAFRESLGGDFGAVPPYEMLRSLKPGLPRDIEVLRP